MIKSRTICIYTIIFNLIYAMHLHHHATLNIMHNKTICNKNEIKFSTLQKNERKKICCGCSLNTRESERVKNERERDEKCHNMAHMQKEISFNKSYFYDFMMWACCRQKKIQRREKCFKVYEMRERLSSETREREREKNI